MNNKNIIKFFSIFFSVLIITVLSSFYVHADDEVSSQEIQVSKEILPSSFWYNFVKFKELIQLNLLTFKDESKASLLEKYTDQRIDEMKYAESIEDYDSLDVVVERYNFQKTDALEYANKVASEDVVNQVKENVLEQQQVMTQIQLKLDNEVDVQKNIVDVQNSVAVETKNVIKEVLGETKVDEFNEDLVVVWMDPNADEFGNLPTLPDNIDPDKWEYAPGTKGRTEAGVVIEYSVGVSNSSGNNNVVETDDDANNDTGNKKNVVVDDVAE